MNFAELQDLMRKQAADDKKNKNVSISADSLQEGLQKASIELGAPINKLEYEVIQKGNPGFLGMGKLPWLLMVYTSAEPLVEESDISHDFDFAFDAHGDNADGKVYIRRSPE